jgi:cob(I)alamin adenosyltransferase
VKKDHVRVEACGDVDELNASLGILATKIPDSGTEIQKEIQGIQSALFYAGATLATTPGSPLLSTLRKIREDDIRTLERAIDRMDEGLDPLTGFILPGGHPCAAFAHLSRTVCRRAERRVSDLLREDSGEGGTGAVLAYLNRLSDYLFTLARHLNRMMGFEDVPWVKR